jgi:very-short-patch-repair endonuclease
MTLSEKLMWAELRKFNLNIRRQAPIGRYIADFALHRANLVIEIDSPRHDLPESQSHDAERDAWLTSQGYTVLRVRDNDVFQNMPSVMARITAELNARGFPVTWEAPA